MGKQIERNLRARLVTAEAEVERLREWNRAAEARLQETRQKYSEIAGRNVNTIIELETQRDHLRERVRVLEQKRDDLIDRLRVAMRQALAALDRVCIPRTEQPSLRAKAEACRIIQEALGPVAIQPKTDVDKGE